MPYITSFSLDYSLSTSFPSVARISLTLCFLLSLGLPFFLPPITKLSPFPACSFCLEGNFSLRSLFWLQSVAAVVLSPLRLQEVASISLLKHCCDLISPFLFSSSSSFKSFFSNFHAVTLKIFNDH